MIKRIKSYRQRVTASPVVVSNDAAQCQAIQLAQIKMKAAAHIERNPSKRAVFLLG